MARPDPIRVTKAQARHPKAPNWSARDTGNAADLDEMGNVTRASARETPNRTR